VAETDEPGDPVARPAPERPGDAELVAVAAAATGRRLSEPVRLAGGSDQSAVLRCHDQAGGTVIVKAYPQTREGEESFTAEATGLAMAAGTGLAPELAGADPAELVVVMSDLGDGTTLADLLLGDAAGDVSEAVLSWARACGSLAVAASKRLDVLPALRARYSRGQLRWPALSELAASIRAAPERAAMAGVAAPPGLPAELAEIASAAECGEFGVFSPGDLCPDNNLVTPAGVRLLDFEAAGVYPVFLDAAYIRMPFSTCWCVFRLPEGLGQAAEAVYRELVSEIWPELARDEVWQAGMRRGIAAWSLNSMGWLLRRSMAGDFPLDEDRISPRTRQLMRYRWRTLAGELEPSGEFPAVAQLARLLLAATDGWDAAALPLYPVFRSR
jgi:hypothetical protein